MPTAGQLRTVTAGAPVGAPAARVIRIGPRPYGSAPGFGSQCLDGTAIPHGFRRLRKAPPKRG
jgi:hypothetical protein